MKTEEEEEAVLVHVPLEHLFCVALGRRSARNSPLIVQHDMGNLFALFHVLCLSRGEDGEEI